MEDYRGLGDTELVAEMRRLAALRTPATLGAYLDPDFALRAHTTVIGNALAGLGEDYDRLMLITPPQIGKSTCAAQFAPLWWLARNPKQRVVIGSYGAKLATRHSRAARDLVRDHGHRFGLRLRRDTTAADEWYVHQGGGVKAVGVGGGITGFPADKVVVDDPFKGRAEAQSRLMRDNASDWWSASIVSRLAPACPICLVNTAWHEDDLRGRLLRDEGRIEEGGRWKVVHLPAFADLALTGGTDPLGRVDGEPLTHPKLPDSDVAGRLAHWEDKRASSLPRDFIALYQGDPKPTEGALVSRALLARQRYFRNHPAWSKTVIAVDPADGERDTIGIIGAHLGGDGRLYWMEDATAVMPVDVWPRTVCEMAARLDADRIVVEKNYGGNMARRLIRTAWSALAAENPGGPYSKLPPQIGVVVAKKNKILRAEPIAQALSEDQVRFGTYMPETEEEWATHQSTSTDSPGRLDASVYAAYALLPIPGAGAVISSPVGVPKQAAGGGGGWASRPIHRSR